MLDGTRETFTQPLLPQPRGVVPHAAGDQLAAEQGQPGVLHRLLRLDAVQEEPQLRQEEQRQSLQGWAKKVVHRLREFFMEVGSNGRDKMDKILDEFSIISALFC